MTLREVYYRKGKELAAKHLKAEEHSIVSFNALDHASPQSRLLRDAATEGLLLGFIDEATRRGWRYRFESGVEVICWMPQK